MLENRQSSSSGVPVLLVCGGVVCLILAWFYELPRFVEVPLTDEQKHNWAMSNAESLASARETQRLADAYSKHRTTPSDLRREASSAAASARKRESDIISTAPTPRMKRVESPSQIELRVFGWTLIAFAAGIWFISSAPPLGSNFPFHSYDISTVSESQQNQENAKLGDSGHHKPS